MSQPQKSPTPSHDFLYSGADIARVLLASLGGFIAVVLLLHAFNMLGWLPKPVRVEGTEQAMIRRRMLMAKSDAPAAILIVGDSSSAISVKAPLLSELLPGRPAVLNQGLFMFLNFAVYADAATQFIDRHPGQVKMVVMIVTMQKLQVWRTGESGFGRLWQQLTADAEPPATHDDVHRWLAIPLARETMFNRQLPFVAYGRAERFYGDSCRLKRQFDDYDGTMFTPGWFDRPNNASDYSWSFIDPVRMEAELPHPTFARDIVFVLGLAPVPESVAGTGFGATRNTLLAELGAIMQPDVLLTNLPATMPDGLFATLNHLNPRGAERFTRLLADELSKQGSFTEPPKP